MLAAISFWHPIASVVILHPFTISKSGRAGMAVISLLLSFHCYLPRHHAIGAAPQITMCIMAFLPPSPLLHILLPSMLITCPSVILAIDCTRLIKHFCSTAGSISENTLLKVSSDGMPEGSSSTVFSQSSFCSSYNSISFQSSAPQITATTAMKRTSINLCSFLCFLAPFTIWKEIFL